MSFTVGSLFDGSGGFPLSAFMCCGEPVWASEVEPYPIAVTKSRFPYMKHLGSVTDIKGNEVEPVDVITFGSPCQDLSVAGKRAGLKHEDNGDEETTRSGLFMEAVRIIKEMREATNGVYPRFALWENVPGAFSSNKGEDFRIVLEELIKIVEPSAVMPTVPRSGWPYSDYYCGNGWSIAYRVLDAQFWGVPHRRRRIYLVLDLGGQCAGKVLFERKGLRGYFEEGRAPWEGVAGNVADSAGTADCARIGINGEVAATLDASYYKGCGMRQGVEREVVAVPVAYSFDALSSNSMKSSNPNSGCRQVEVAKCIDTTDPNPSKNQGGIAILEPCVLESAGFKELNSAKARSDGYEYEVAPCLSANKHDASVCVKCYDARGNGDGFIAPTITGDHNNRVTDYTSVVCEPKLCFWDESQTASTLTANNANGAQRMPDKENFNCVIEQRPVVLDRAFYNQGVNAQYDPQLYEDGTCPTLVAKGPAAVCTQYIVRRLTPTECARLQGFPDGWGHPDKKTEFSDEDYSFWLNVRNTHAEINGKATKDYTRDQMLSWYNKLHTDSSEYKMWGNGIALPCALYVMQGIAEVLN